MRGLSRARGLFTGVNGLYSALVYENTPGPRPVVSALAEKGIHARRLWPTLHRQRLYKPHERLRGDAAGRGYRPGLSLPSSSHLTEGAQCIVTENLEELLR